MGLSAREKWKRAAEKEGGGQERKVNNLLITPIQSVTTTPANKKTTSTDSAYSNAVKTLQSSGVDSAAASGIMTRNEWRRRKKSSGYNTYEEYLDGVVRLSQPVELSVEVDGGAQNFGKLTLGGYKAEDRTPQSNATAPVNMPMSRDEWQRRILTIDHNTYEEYVDDFWQKRFEELLQELTERHKGEELYRPAAEALAIVEKEKQLYEDINKFGDVVNKDDFGGQWRANYRSTELSEDAAKAFSYSMDNSDIEHRELAFAYDAFVKEYMKNNEKALDDEGQVLPLLSDNFASHLAQIKGSAGIAIPAGTVGALGGFMVAGPAGAKAGWTTGYSIGSGINSYNVIRGSVFSELLSYGLDEETAKKLANDDAFIEALIEGGETAIDWIGLLYTGGAGNLFKSGTKIASKTIPKVAATAAKSAGRPLLNLGGNIVKGIVKNGLGEGIEEGLQGAASRATREKAWAMIEAEIGQYGVGNIDLYNRPIYENADGTVSTVDSITVQIDDKFVVLPTIIRGENGEAIRLEETEDIVAHYVKTGEYLGEFDTLEDANGYANRLHYAQAYHYSDSTSVDADDNALTGGAKVLVDAIFGGNTEALKEIGGQSWEGVKTSVVTGGIKGAGKFVVTSYANAKTITEQNEIADFVKGDEETLNVLIEEAKASGEGTVSAKIAEEVEQAKEKGKVTRAQVKKLIASNDVYIKAEEQASTTDTLENAAMDVVADRNATQTAKTTPISNATATGGNLPTQEASTQNAPINARRDVGKGVPLAERLEAQSLNNEPITVEDVKKATVFGDEGSKLVAELANNDGVTFSQAERAVKTAYMAGFANVESSKVSFETDTQIDAFTAGKKDRAMQDLAAKENAKNATVYDGAFTENEYTKDFSDAEKTMISTVVKGLKMDISVVDKIVANVVEGKVHEADAEHKDGKMRISSATEKLLYEILMHEGGHRMEQLAPAEFGVLMDALYERAEGRSIRLGVSQGLVLDSVKAQHDNAGITKDTRGYMEEFAVRELETIFGSPEEFNKWYAEISGNQQVKNAWEKFISWLSDVIEDIKKAWSQRNMTAEEKAEAKKAVAELERIKGLLANTYKAAENAAQNRASEVQSERAQKNANAEADVDYSLMEFEDGKKFVNVDVDQALFDGKTLKEQAMLARDIIKKRFAGKVIGNINRVFVNGNSAEEYSWLRRSRDEATAEAKMRASTELDNLIDAGTNFRNKPDGEYGHIHEDAIDGFSYFDVIFKVAGEYYYGLINIENNSRGWLLKDITQIKNITDDVTASYGENPTSSVVSDVQVEQSEASDETSTNDSITQTEENSQEKLENVFKEDKAVKRDFSLKEENAQYTDQEYRDFGWARENGILSADQNADYRSKFAMAKSGQMKFPKSKKGEFIIPVSDIYDSDKEGINNVLVFAKGTIDKPIVTSIIEIYEYDETSLDRIRRRIYDCERRGIQQEAGELFERYDAVDYKLRPNQQRIGSESVGNSSDNGYGKGSRGETSSIKGETRVNFSLKGTNNISTKDRKVLLDIIEHLKGEFEITKFVKADPKKLAKMTKALLKEYNSLADIDETLKSIDDLYQYMANGEAGHPAAWEEVYNRAYDIAQEIVKNALVTDDAMYREYESLRNYLRTTPMKFYEGTDVPSRYENFNDFRKRNMGRLNFTNNGSSIDSVYQELAELYPEFFDTDRDITTSAQLETIVDALDSLKAIEVNPFDGQIGQASMHLANDIISRFFDIPQSKPTFADKAERRVTDAKIAGAKKVEAVRQQRDEKIQKLMETQREKTKKQLDKLREQRDSKVKKEREKRREAVSKMGEKQKEKVLRAQIMRHTSDLSKKLINPTDNQHIPQELQGVVAKLLECINLESNYTYDTDSRSYKKNDEGLPTKRTKAFEELRSIYNDIASSVVVDPDLVGEGGLLSDVILLADKRIADMTTSELEIVWQTMRAIEASVSTANKMFSQGKFETILEFAEALRKDNTSKKEKTEFKGVLGKGKKLAALDMLTPETYLHYLGSSGDSIFRMMRDAQDKHISIMKEVSDFTHKALKSVDVNSLEESVHTIKLGGEDVQLSTAQLMELYVLTKREQAVDHIFVGGILPDVTKSKGMKLNAKAEPIRSLTMAEISDALSKLTDEQKKIADKLQRYVSTVLSEYGNEASMRVYNYEKFLEKNYWPIRTNKQEIVSEVGKDTAVTSVANKGMAKGTKPHANTSVLIGSIFDTFSAHSSEMATYAAWLGTSEDVNRIRNFVFWEDGARTGTVKGILDTVHGIHGSEYLQKLLTDIAIGVKGTDNMNPLDNFIGSYKAASVGANLRVIIQQPTAILRALDMIDARYLAEGALRPPKGWEKAKKYAPIAQWKDWGHFDINTGRQMKDVLFDNASLLEKTKQVGMWGASKADSLSWGMLWNAVEAETKANRKELEVGSDAYYETVAKRFTEIVDHTQVVDGILQRSQIMRSPDALTKMATSFMGEPTKQYNMAVSAAYDAKNSKGEAQKKAVARLGRTAASLAVAGIINACAQSIIDAMRDDDKEKYYWEKWLAALIGDGEETSFAKSNVADTINPLNYVPFAKDIMSIMQGYDVKRMDAEAITKTFNAVTNMYKAVTGTGKYTVAEASAQLFAEIGRLYGLPVANVKRDIKSLVMLVAIGTDSYLMQYRMEKAMLDINYAGNSKNFMDILFNAYNNDREAYEYIYSDMITNGISADKIKLAMETRLKKAEGVKEASELSKRYMTPANEKKYDSSLKKVKSSNAWKSANDAQKKNAEDDLYEFLTSTSEDMKKVRTEAREFGVDETEYTLWQLAIEMADQPKGQEGSGTYDSKEKAEAINSLNLGDREIAYFFGKGLNESSKQELNETLNAGIDIQEYVNFKAATSEMKADKNANGNSIPNSKKRKVVNYLNNANLTDEEWNYFYYEIMNYKK